jgi:hypothetical protein
MNVLAENKTLGRHSRPLSFLGRRSSPGARRHFADTPSQANLPRRLSIINQPQSCAPTEMKSNQHLVVYVDVDDTLLRSAGTKTMPMPRVVEHVKSLADSGAEL